MTESLTAAAACGNPVHFEGTEKDVCSLLKMLGKETGFVEHLGGLYEKMTVKQYLQFFAGLSGTEKKIEFCHRTDAPRRTDEKETQQMH